MQLRFTSEPSPQKARGRRGKQYPVIWEEMAGLALHPVGAERCVEFESEDDASRLERTIRRYAYNLRFEGKMKVKCYPVAPTKIWLERV